MRKLLGTMLAVAALAVGLNGMAAAEPLRIVATTSMIGDSAQRVAGDRAEVVALMGPGVDPHAYRQTRSDIANVVGSDLVLWHGLYLEAQMEEFFLDLGARMPVVAVGEGVSEDQLLSHDDYAGRYDPHVWMDPDLWPQVVVTIRDALIEIDPKGETVYRANAEEYLQSISDLADYAQSVLGSIPEDQRVLISAHDAFNYFGNAFDFDVVGIQGISTEAEAGLRRIEDLVSLLVENEISAVFVESSVSDRNIRALIEGAAARGHEVAIGGQLFSDAMGQPGTYEGSYIGMIDHNATTITRALGGDAPEQGMQGRLGAGS
ncbi:MAG: zinc ABC transporter substrate-binding protein [Pseudomonadota bacterium]